MPLIWQNMHRVLHMHDGNGEVKFTEYVSDEEKISFGVDGFETGSRKIIDQFLHPIGRAPSIYGAEITYCRVGDFCGDLVRVAGFVGGYFAGQVLRIWSL